MFRLPTSILPLLLLFSSNATQKQPPPLCEEQCGDLQLPYPFHLSPTCGHTNGAFRLSCRKYTQKDLLLLTLNSTDLLVRGFLPETGTLLVDFPRDYFRVNESTVVDDTPFYAVLPKENVVKLYDCDDSTVCKMRCFGGNGCCYPLKDGSVWKIGDGFSVFSQFGCRGFSTWVIKGSSSPSSSSSRVVRGIEIEWAVPRGSGDRSVCAKGAVVVNATAVDDGVRCECTDGLAGDGFVDGIGCLEYCTIDGRLAYGVKCCNGGWSCHRGTTILMGILAAVMSLAALAMVCALIICRMKRNTRRDCKKPATYLSNIIGGGRHGIRIFTYQQLFDATGGFSDAHKLIDDVDETVHIGELDHGDNITNNNSRRSSKSTVAVQKLKCQTEQALFQVIDLVGKLSQASHRNVVRVLGCCIDPNINTLLLVHEFAHGCTLEDHLRRRKRASGLNWPARLNIALEVASALAWVQSELHPQLSIQDLRSSDILLLLRSSRLSCFKLLSLSRYSDIIRSSGTTYSSHTVYDYGFLLMEIVVGRRHEDLPNLVWPKMCSGNLDEVVDPYLGYRRLSPREAKQIERVTDLATQCLLCGQNNGVCCMDDVVKELACIKKGSDDDNISCASSESCTVDGASSGLSALEVRFSDSSFLQMISMSSSQSKSFEDDLAKTSN